MVILARHLASDDQHPIISNNCSAAKATARPLLASASGSLRGRSAWRAGALLIATVLLQLLTQYGLNFWNRRKVEQRLGFRFDLRQEPYERIVLS